MARDYELMYIVRPDLDDEAVQAAMDSVQSLIEAQGGEVVTTTPWGKRRLAYEIERLRDGHYVLLHIRLDGDRVKELERLLAIHDTVFRHLLTIYVEDRGHDGAPAPPDGEQGDEARESRPRGPRPRAEDRSGVADDAAHEDSAPAAVAAGASHHADEPVDEVEDVDDAVDEEEE